LFLITSVIAIAIILYTRENESERESLLNNQMEIQKIKNESLAHMCLLAGNIEMLDK